ncbi:MAG: GNAT family N-acetyltransferase [Xanthomonadales bacterium]|nr:GNAT family N-acetyltransferase [Xanthomonadales bacterium]
MTHLRRAGPDDADTLAALSTATFRQAFGHLYQPQDLAAFLEEVFAAGRQRAQLSDPQQAVWLLQDARQAVGLVAAGPCQLPHPEVAPGDGELRRLYLLASHQGKGHGGRLMQTAMDWLLRDGPRVLWLGVWSENHGAQRFYRRWGFEPVGEYLFPVGQARDREFILRRPAAADRHG